MVSKGKRNSQTGLQVRLVLSFAPSKVLPQRSHQLQKAAFGIKDIIEQIIWSKFFLTTKSPTPHKPWENSCLCFLFPRCQHVLLPMPQVQQPGLPMPSDFITSLNVLEQNRSLIFAHVLTCAQDINDHVPSLLSHKQKVMKVKPSNKIRQVTFS